MQYHTKINDGELSWRARNIQASGLPLILLHGATCNKDIWLSFSRRLAALLPDKPIIFLDLPGHGSSTVPARKEIEAFKQDILNFLDAQAWPQVDLLGHSMGGAISQALAAAHPDRVRRLILLSTGPKLYVAPILFEVLPDQPEKALFLYRSFAFGPTTPPEMVELAMEQMTRCDPHTAHDDFFACHNWRAGERLKSITAPTLVIVGESDALTPVSLGEKLVNEIPNARLVVFPQCGHMTPQEREADLSEAVKTHLEN